MLLRSGLEETKDYHQVNQFLRSSRVAVLVPCPMRQQANTIPVIKVIAWKWIENRGALWLHIIQELAQVKIFPKKIP